jgi:hypothetical protein
VAGEWPLVGRDDELERLESWGRARDLQGAVVIGPAGVGKSRLAHEAVARAKAGGMVTVRVAGTNAAGALPFGAFAPLLPPPETDSEVTGRGDLMRRLHTALVEQAGGQRFLLFVDDAHLLDDHSALLTHDMAASGSAFVLATVRAGEQPPKAVTALWETGLAEVVTLSGLPEDAVAGLLAAVLSGPVDKGTVARLASQSEGNVLLLQELVSEAVASGALRREGGVYRLVGSVAPSPRLVELIEARFTGLTEEERSVLEALSVGEPLGAAELQAVSAPEVLTRLDRRGFISRRLDGRRVEFRLAHPVYGDVLRGSLPYLRLR